MLKALSFPLVNNLFFIGLILSDRLLKLWASSEIDPIYCGPFTIETVYNFGVVGGSYSHLPPLIKTVTLASIGALIFCFYGFAKVFIPMQSRWLKLGLTAFVAGIIGNVWDRLLCQGAVVDFISLQTDGWRSPVANPADVFQIIGIFSISFGLWKDSQHFWFKDDQRASYRLVNRPLQLRFMFLILGLGLGSSLITSVMSYAFLKVVIQDREQLDSYLIALGAVHLSLMLVLLIVGRFASAKIAGPLHAIRNYLQRILDGNSESFSLRSGDELREFEGPLNQINEKLRDQTKNDRAA